MYNFNYEYMTFLYVVHVYMFCNVALYCIALPARVLFAIKIIIIIKKIIRHVIVIIINITKQLLFVCLFDDVPRCFS